MYFGYPESAVAFLTEGRVLRADSVDVMEGVLRRMDGDSESSMYDEVEDVLAKLSGRDAFYVNVANREDAVYPTSGEAIFGLAVRWKGRGKFANTRVFQYLIENEAVEAADFYLDNRDRFFSKLEKATRSGKIVTVEFTSEHFSLTNSFAGEV